MPKATKPINSGYTVIMGTGTGTNGSHIDVWVEYKVTNVSTTNLTCYLQVKFYAEKNGTGASGSSGSSMKAVSVNIDGSSRSTSTSVPYDFSDYGPILIWSGNKQISQPNGAARSVPIIASFTTKSEYITGGYVGTSSSPKYASVPAIQTATVPTASDGEIGTSMTIGLSGRMSASYKDTLTYSFGTATGTIVTKTSDASVSWTPPLSLAYEIPSSSTGTLTIICNTYNSDDVLVGSSTVSVSLTVPSSMVPTGTILETDTSSAIVAKFNSYIQNKTRLRIQTTGTASYGATISNYIIEFDGHTYVGNDITTSEIKSYGSLTIKATIVDSRGRSGVVEKSITVSRYSSPTISATAKRCDESGNIDESGEYLKVTANISISPLDNLNDKSFMIEIKQVGEDEWDEYPITMPSYSLTNYTRIFEDILPTYDYQVRLTASDWFTSSQPVQRLLLVKMTTRLIDWGDDGVSIAFGKIAEREGFEIGMDFYADNHVIGSALPQTRSSVVWSEMTLYTDDLGRIFMRNGEGGVFNLQTKTITPTKATQNVLPDSGYDGLSMVVVEPIPPEYVPGTASVQSKTVTPTTSQQTIVPDIGYDYLSSVIVNAIPSQYKDTTLSSSVAATAANILTGKSAYANGSKIDGSMPNNGAINGIISTKDQVYSVQNGYHNGSGTVRIATEAIQYCLAQYIRQGYSILGVAGSYTGSGASLQAKTFTPTKNGATVTADSGYDGLSSVTVNAVPYTATVNADGGTEIMIG